MPSDNRGGDLRFAVLARRLAGQLEEDVVERRSAQAQVADADPGATELGRGLLDEDELTAIIVKERLGF